MVVATVRTILAQPDETATRHQLRVVADMLRPKFAAAADLLDEAETDLCGYATFPRAHWRKLCDGLLPLLMVHTRDCGSDREKLFLTESIPNAMLAAVRDRYQGGR